MRKAPACFNPKTPDMEVPFVPFGDKPTPVSAGTQLDLLPAVPIACNPWPQYAHKVQAAFTLAHSGDALLLKYYISESHVTAAAAQNGDIHKDSCVELFIAFGEDGNYYNLEFNCLGWFKAGYGRNREARSPLPGAVAELVTSSTTISTGSREGEKLFQWTLTLVIPVNVFCYHTIKDLGGHHARANFYKCGDDLPAPHFLTWSPVRAAIPDFHREADFGKINFL